MTRIRDQHGYSLVELLVAMALSTIVFGATLSVLDVFQTNNRYDQLRNENQDSARSALDALTKDIRNVAAPSLGYYGALEEAGAYSIMFQTVDPFNSPTTEDPTAAIRVRYCLDDSSPTNEILWKQIRRAETGKKLAEAPTPTECPDKSSKDFESSTTLVQNVTNRIGGQKQTERSLFVYSATSIPQILSIETNLYLDLNPGHPPGETRLTSGVSLRNANRQPIAKFKATVVKGHVQLNASESYDPDGLSLTYKWFEGSKELSGTGQEYETAEFKAGTQHEFKLTVTDPGGLSASEEQTVKT